MAGTAKKNQSKAHRTSIGNSSNTKPNHKSASKKRYRGQGKAR